MEKLAIIDGNSLINRAFYAIPLLTNSEGEYSNAVYGFCNILVKLINTYKPDYLAVAFDYGRHTFRTDLYSEYKSTRKGMPDELRKQLPILKSVLTSMNIKFIEKDGIEADDIIGTLSKKFDIEKIIVSGDRDVFQLIDNNTKVWFTKKGISEVQELDEDKLKQEYALTPKQVIEMKALMGDAGDNIPGVCGIGEKTTKDLLLKYNDLDNIYKNIDDITGSLKTKLINGKEMAYLSKTLGTININCDINCNLEDLKYNFPFKKETFDLFLKYDFKSLLKRAEIFDNIDTIKEVNAKEVLLHKVTTENELNKLVDEVLTIKEVAIYFGADIHMALSRYEEYQICIKQDLINTGFDFEFVLDKIKPILTDSTIKRTIFDYKQLKHYLINFNTSIQSVDFDVIVAQYLINSGKNVDKKLDDTLLTISYPPFAYASGLLTLKMNYINNLKELNMLELYNNVELKLIDVLFSMEQNGIKIDGTELDNVQKELKILLDNLTQNIYSLAGLEFNINSPKQLASVLFDKMLLNNPNKNKISTDVSVLESMKGEHEIIEKILQYREINKLLNTYVDVFKVKIDKKTGLIHTMFNQTLTSTGRLSSSEPNLQNIPMRKESGKLIRKMFVPRDNNGYLISADYSQIELRLLAHLSGDKKLIDAFNNNEDIHTRTASELNNISIDEVSSSMRRDAKAVNFGIIYGISDFGLAQNINHSRLYAKEMIERYFRTYPSVKQYMDNNIEFAKENGYSLTMFNRRRNIPELKFSNYVQRQFGERVAMNMPLQGSASDIIKIAMIKVFNELKNNNMKSKLILQIHDELIIDAFAGEEKEVCKILTNSMENVVKLSIPLSVSISMGKNWSEAK